MAGRLGRWPARAHVPQLPPVAAPGNEGCASAILHAHNHVESSISEAPEALIFQRTFQFSRRIHGNSHPRPAISSDPPLRPLLASRK
eukprot:2697268-Prymnesium_polylepis.1